MTLRKLSWSHYCELFTILDLDKYSFYEKETMFIKKIQLHHVIFQIKNN